MTPITLGMNLLIRKDVFTEMPVFSWEKARQFIMNAFDTKFREYASIAPYSPSVEINKEWAYSRDEVISVYITVEMNATTSNVSEYSRYGWLDKNMWDKLAITIAQTFRDGRVTHFWEPWEPDVRGIAKYADFPILWTGEFATDDATVRLMSEGVPSYAPTCTRLSWWGDPALAPKPQPAPA